MVVMVPYKNCSDGSMCYLSKRPTCWKRSPYSVGRGDGANRGLAYEGIHSSLHDPSKVALRLAWA